MVFSKTGHTLDGLLYSAANLLTFLPGTKGRFESLEKDLFGGHMPDGVVALGMLEGVLGLVFLFLIGLALRNRFRI